MSEKPSGRQVPTASRNPAGGSAGSAVVSPSEPSATGAPATVAPSEATSTTPAAAREEQRGAGKAEKHTGIAIPLHVPFLIDVRGGLGLGKVHTTWPRMKLPIRTTEFAAWMISHLGSVLRAFKRIERLGGEAVFEYGGTTMHHVASYTFVDFIEMVTIHALLTDKESRAELMDLIVDLYEEGAIRDESGNPLKETAKLSSAEFRRLLEESADNYVKAVETARGNPVVAHVAIRALDHNVLWMSIVTNMVDAFVAGMLKGKNADVDEGPIKLDYDFVLELAKRVRSALADELSKPERPVITYERARWMARGMIEETRKKIGGGSVSDAQFGELATQSKASSSEERAGAPLNA